MVHGISFCSVCGQRSPHHWPNCPNNNYTGAETNTMAVGWICPRCNCVNAPDVKQCGCEPEVERSNPDNTDGKWLSGTSNATYEVPSGWQVY